MGFCFSAAFQIGTFNEQRDLTAFHNLPPVEKSSAAFCSLSHPSPLRSKFRIFNLSTWYICGLAAPRSVGQMISLGNGFCPYYNSFTWHEKMIIQSTCPKWRICPSHFVSKSFTYSSFSSYGSIFICHKTKLKVSMNKSSYAIAF